MILIQVLALDPELIFSWCIPGVLTAFEHGDHHHLDADWICLVAALPRRSSNPSSIKVVVVAMFERGEDTGDTPGEYQLWVEREHLIKSSRCPPGITMCA